jgi:hypothetical protein
VDRFPQRQLRRTVASAARLRRGQRRSGPEFMDIISFFPARKSFAPNEHVFPVPEARERPLQLLKAKRSYVPFGAQIVPTVRHKPLSRKRPITHRLERRDVLTVPSRRQQSQSEHRGSDRGHGVGQRRISAGGYRRTPARARIAPPPGRPSSSVRRQLARAVLEITCACRVARWRVSVGARSRAGLHSGWCAHPA